MKIVIDTNVLISAFLFGGISADVYDYCYIFHKMYLSEWILNEFKKKLITKFKIPEEKIKIIIKQIKTGCIIINPNGVKPSVCRYPDNNNIVHLARYIKSDYIISDDSDLLDLQMFNKFRILHQHQYIDIHL